MPHRFSLIGILSLVLICLPCLAQETLVWDESTMTDDSTNITLMGNPVTFRAAATDPEGHALSYQWRIVSDPTGKANFAQVNRPYVTVDFPWVSASSNPIGSSIIIEVTVNHTDTQLHGDVGMSRQFEAVISGVNQPPQPVIVVDPESSATNPIREGDGVSFSSDSSVDPDSSGMRHEWIAQTLQGSFLQPLVFFGTEGTSSGFTIPGLATQTAQVMVTLVLIDGLHEVRKSTTVYLAKRQSSGNTLPVITATSPVNILAGDPIQLSASVTDAEDPCSFTWTFVQGSGTTMDPIVTTVRNSPPYQWNVGGTHPALSVGTYQFRLRATENRSGGQYAEKTITVNVTQTPGGGPGGSTPENGGAADWVPTTTGCTSNTPPTVSISPAANQFKPLYTGGSTVSLTVTATDASEKENLANPDIKSTGARIFWVDYSELTALGVNVQAANYVKTSSTTSTATISFTAPNTTATAHITFRAVDVFDCQTSIRFAVAFKPASANTPPTARIKYKIDNGTLTTPTGNVAVITNASHTITLDGTGSTDPGGAISSYQWSLTGASGLSLTGANSSTASFVVPVGFAGSANVSLTVRDSAQVSNSTSMTFNFTAASATAPVARIKYKIGSSGTLAEAPATITLNLTGSQTVTFDGRTSSDPQAGVLTYAWTKDTAGLTGSATAIGGAASESYTVNFSGSARGTVVITLTVKDPNNETGTASVIVNVQGPPPVARIKYGVGSGALTAATPPPPIETDTAKVIHLDGSTSSVEGGTIASFAWSVTETPGVTLTGETTASATLAIAAGTLGTVTVSLTVKDAANQEDGAQIIFEMVEKVEIPALYFPQVGVGPSEVIGQELKTVILLVNDTDRDAHEVSIEFFDQKGDPLNPTVNGQAWENESFEIKQMTSQRFTFSNPEIRVGWARVTSDVKLFGMVQYQMFELVSGNLVREISLFSSPPAKKVVTFFDPAEPIAIAIANPGDSPTKLVVKVVDTENGESVLSTWQVFPDLPSTGLGKNTQLAVPLPEGALPPYAKPGSLVIQSENGQDIVVTILKTTKIGEAFSTLPISVTR